MLQWVYTATEMFTLLRAKCWDSFCHLYVNVPATLTCFVKLPCPPANNALH